MDKDLRWRRLKILFGNYSSYFSNVVIFLVIVYFLFIVGKALFHSYQDQKDMTQKKDEIISLKAQVIYFENQNLYFQTQSYKEKEARKKLGMVKPGETAVALNRTTDQSQQITVPAEKKLDLPNYIRWWDYFFSG